MATAIPISMPRRVIPICLPTAATVAAIFTCSASNATPAKVPPPAMPAGTFCRLPSGAGVPLPATVVASCPGGHTGRADDESAVDP